MNFDGLVDALDNHKEGFADGVIAITKHLDNHRLLGLLTHDLPVDTAAKVIGILRSDR